MAMYFSNHAYEIDNSCEIVGYCELLGVAHSQQRVGEGVYGKGDTVGDAGLAHQLCDVRLDRALLDAQGGANFSIGSSGHQQVQHFTFALGENQGCFARGAAGNGGDPFDELADQMPGHPDRSAHGRRESPA